MWWQTQILYTQGETVTYIIYKRYKVFSIVVNEKTLKKESGDSVQMCAA